MNRYRLYCSECGKGFRTQSSRRVDKKELPRCPNCGGRLDPRFGFSESELEDHSTSAVESLASAETVAKSSDPPKQRVSSGAKIILLIALTAALSTWLVITLLVPEQPKLAEHIHNPHFRAEPKEPEIALPPQRVPEQAPEEKEEEESPTPQEEVPEINSVGPLIPFSEVQEEPVILGDELPKIHYGWEDGRYYTFRYTVAAEPGKGEKTFSGICRFVVGPTWGELITEQSEPTSIEPEIIKHVQELQAGAGSAFVVSSDGYLVSNAHVVKGAQTIVVELNGASYEARTVVVDYENDLALLRVSAKDLTPLSLGDSSAVRLGEDVRVIGYPLSFVLKNRLNATQGTVSSIQAEEDDGLMQVDAAVNPGNSGGPLINDRGQLIGVVSSMFYGEAVSNVGFAVPSNTVSELLESRGISMPNDPLPEGITGPDLVDQVAKSVALVKVLSIDKTQESKKLNYTCWQKGRAVPSEGISWTTDDTAESGTCQVDILGRVSELKGPLRVQFLWFHPLELLIEHLDSEGSDEWIESLDHTIVVRPPESMSLQSESAFLPGRGRFPGGFPRPLTIGRDFPLDDNRPTRYKSETESRFKVVDPKSKVVTLLKTSKLVARNFEGEPAFTMQGPCMVKFDTQQSIPIEGFSELTCDWQKTNAEKTFPVRFAFQQASVNRESIERTLEQTEKELREQSEKLAEQHAKVNQSSGELFESCLKSIVERLQSGDSIGQLLAELNSFPFEQSKRSDVVDVLKKAVQLKDASEVSAAYEVWEKWADAQDLPFLMEQLDQFEKVDDDRREAIVKVLGVIGSPRAAERIVEAMKSANDDYFSHVAARALTQIGSTAEPYVIPLLDSADEDLRESACDILGDIGSEKCLAHLTDMTVDEDAFLKARAKSAIRRIKRRAEGPLTSGVRTVSKTRLSTESTQQSLGQINKARYAIATLQTDEIRASRRADALADLASVPRINELVPSAVECIVPHLELTSRPGVIIAAIRAIGVWGDESHAAKLNKLLPLAKSREAKEAIFTALGSIGNEESANLLMPYLDNPNFAYRVLPAFLVLSSELEERLIAMLQDKDVYRRARAAAVLGCAGGEPAQKALEELYDQGDDTIALEAVIVALSRLKVRGVTPDGPSSQ